MNTVKIVFSMYSRRLVTAREAAHEMLFLLDEENVEQVGPTLPGTVCRQLYRFVEDSYEGGFISQFHGRSDKSRFLAIRKWFDSCDSMSTVDNALRFYMNGKCSDQECAMRLLFLIDEVNAQIELPRVPEDVSSVIEKLVASREGGLDWCEWYDEKNRDWVNPDAFQAIRDWYASRRGDVSLE